MIRPVKKEKMTAEEAKARLDELFAESNDLLTELHFAGQDDLVDRLLTVWEEAKEDLSKAVREAND